MAIRLLIETQTGAAIGQQAIALDALTELAAPLTSAAWLLAYVPTTGMLHKVRLTSFLYAGLPTTDPQVVGALFTTAGALMVSTGPP